MLEGAVEGSCDGGGVGDAAGMLEGASEGGCDGVGVGKVVVDGDTDGGGDMGKARGISVNGIDGPYVGLASGNAVGGTVGRDRGAWPGGRE